MTHIYMNAKQHVKKQFDSLREIEKVTGEKIVIDHDFYFTADKLIEKIKDLQFVMIPISKKEPSKKRQKEIKAAQAALKEIPINKIRKVIDDQKANINKEELAPQKVEVKNNEEIKMINFISHKEKMITFVELLVDCLNQLPFKERKCLYYDFIKGKNIVALEAILLASKRSVKEIKKSSIIKLEENLVNASFMKGAFIMGK